MDEEPPGGLGGLLPFHRVTSSGIGSSSLTSTPLVSSRASSIRVAESGLTRSGACEMSRSRKLRKAAMAGSASFLDVASSLGACLSNRNGETKESRLASSGNGLARKTMRRFHLFQNSRVHLITRTGSLVLRFRSSHHFAAPSHANFGIGTLAPSRHERGLCFEVSETPPPIGSAK